VKRTTDAGLTDALQPSVSRTLLGLLLVSPAVNCWATLSRPRRGLLFDVKTKVARWLEGCQPEPLLVEITSEI
jgi:hypothetical protein